MGEYEALRVRSLLQGLGSLPQLGAIHNIRPQTEQEEGHWTTS